MQQITTHLYQQLVKICKDNNLLGPYTLITDIGGNGELLQQLLDLSDSSIGFCLNINENIKHPRLSFLDEKSITSIGDIYLVYNQNKKDYIQILKNIKSKMSSGSKIWIIEERIQEYVNIVNELGMSIENIIPLELLEISLMIVS